MIRLRAGFLSISGVVLGLLSTFAQATSFDCAKASTFAEIQICNSTHLQRLDERLNTAYSEGLASSQDKEKYRSDQRSWLKQRDMCTTQACVTQTIERRLAAINGTPAVSQTIKSGTVTLSATPHSVAQKASLSATTLSAEPKAITTQAIQQQPSVAPTKAVAEDPQTLRPAKVVLLVMGLLLVVCIWLHSRGSMTIYSCYTDALWTTLTPFLATATYFIVGSWLELPTHTAQIAAAVVLGLMLLQVIIQTFRHNGFSIFFLLALYAKLLLFTIYFLCMAVLIFGGVRTAAQKRRQRNLAMGGSVLFALLTGWMTRNRSFSHIDDYIAGRS